MSNCARRDDSTPGDENAILLCHGANEITRQFYSDLSLIDQNRTDWEHFIKRKLAGGNQIEKLSCLKEIGKSGDPAWLDFLFSYSEQETLATVLSAIYGSISTLGGFRSVIDVEKLFDTPDICRRNAALNAIHSMESQNAVHVLRNILKDDPAVSLRREAALRLAYHNMRDGLQELLDSLDDNH